MRTGKSCKNLLFSARVYFLHGKQTMPLYSTEEKNIARRHESSAVTNYSPGVVLVLNATYYRVSTSSQPVTG